MKFLSHRTHPRTNSQSGQALVEMALVLPVLMVLVVGILDFGRILVHMQDAESTASAAARYAAVGRAMPSDLVDFQIGGVDPDVCIEASTLAVGEPLTVTISGTEEFSPLLSFLGSLEINGKAQMRIERLPVDAGVYGGC